MVQRIGPHQLDGAGAVDGDALVYDPIADEYGPGAVVTGLTSADSSVTVTDNGDGTLDLAAAGGGSGSLTVQDENGNVATGVTQIDFQGAGVAAAAGTGEVVVTIPGGGGSSGNGPDGKPTLNTPPSSPATQDDEFNDATGMSGPVNGLNARWSKHNLATASWLVLSDTRSPGAVLFDMPGSQAQDQSIYQAVPASDFRVSCRTASGSQSDRQMWGLFVLNTSGTGVALLLDDPSGDTSTRIRSVTSWVQVASLAVISTNLNARWVNHEPVNLSLRKSGGNYLGSAWQGDLLMASEVAEVSATPAAFTPAYVGFGRLYGAGGGATAAAKVALDWFRVA